MEKSFPLAYALMLGFCISVVYSTYDLNIHQIQFVADHLSETECQNLSAALKQRTYTLQQPLNITEDDRRNCMYLLIRWDRGAGRGKPFLDLALRLGQIGRHDLADILSRSVFSERTAALKRTFLDDPFKKNLPKNSFLLETEDVDEVVTVADASTEDAWTIWYVVCAVTAVFCSVIVTALCFRFVCPGALNKLRKDAMPENSVVLCDYLMEDGCCKRQKNSPQIIVADKKLARSWRSAVKANQYELS